MPCPWCPADGDESNCSLCRADDEHFARRRRYAQTVSVVSLGLLVLIVVVAVACGLVNVLGGKH